MRTGLLKKTLNALSLLAAVGVAGWNVPLRADPIALNNGGGNQSAIFASASDNSDTLSETITDVNSLPYTTPTNETAGTSTSTVTPTLSSSALDFSFSQALTDMDSKTRGEGEIFFQAGAGVSYSIAGSLAAAGIFTGDDLRAVLTDLTTSTQIYNYNVSADSNSLTLDSTGGPLTGSLTAGDAYVFDVYQDLILVPDPPGSTATLVGNGGISFTQAVPEPGSWADLALGLPGLFLWFRFRRADGQI